MSNTNETKHTPGPWHGVYSQGFYFVDSPGEGSICKLARKEFQEANARLIAAAPKLLEALESALSQLRTLTHAHPEDSINNAVLAIGDAAVNEATGR